MNAQAEHRLLNLMGQLEAMQGQLSKLQTETQLNTQSLAALTQSLTDPNAAQATRERLSELNLRLADNQERLDELYKTVSQLPHLDQFESLRQIVTQNVVDREQIEALNQKVADREQIEALAQAITQKVADREQLERLINKVARHEQIEHLEQMVANGTQLDELTKSFKQVSRTQFKANALGETKEGHITESLKTLQELMSRREDVLARRDLETQKQVDDSRTSAQGELIAALLPTLDGLELAMGSGRQMLDKLDGQQGHLTTVHRQLLDNLLHEIQSSTQMGVFQRMRQSFGNLLEIAHPLLNSSHNSYQGEIEAVCSQNHTMVQGWLQGLDMVRERFLQLMAAHGVQPILAQDQPFDPQLHVAIEREERHDIETETVVRVLRQGYRQQDRVLRYAEVVVAHNSNSTQTESDPKQKGNI
ncbi:nucleotide exchange factor GrpE [Chloroflexi bacterium TSY]|nr:nucleotide exchange factor GrpE [Chloroflexi bacterium TSY]